MFKNWCGFQLCFLNNVDLKYSTFEVNKKIREFKIGFNYKCVILNFNNNKIYRMNLLSNFDDDLIDDLYNEIKNMNIK